MNDSSGRTRAFLLVVSLGLAACGSAINGPYTASIASGVAPRMTAEDAIRITRTYLDEQTPELAARPSSTVCRG